MAGSTSFGGVGSGVGTSMFFPDLNVMALTFLGFSTFVMEAYQNSELVPGLAEWPSAPFDLSDSGLRP